MREINGFKVTLICLVYGITLLLVVAIGSLFFMVQPEDILKCIRSTEMIYSLKLSVFTALISTILVMGCSITIGYAMSRFEFFGEKIVRSIFNLPIAFPELVLGLCLLQLFGVTAFGKILHQAGLEVVFTRKGIVVAQFFTALPFAVRIMKSSYDFINPRLESVSRSLGYSPFETFLHVTLPLARNGMVAATVISFARCFGAFGSVLILAGGSYMHTEVLPVTLYLNISYGNMPMAMTSGMVLVGVSFIAIFIFEKAGGRL